MPILYPSKTNKKGYSQFLRIYYRIWVVYGGRKIGQLKFDIHTRGDGQYVFFT